MQLIRKKGYARAGLMGNPSDGYGGKTISLVLHNFFAEVTLYPWDRLEVVTTELDRSCFDSVTDLLLDVRLHGYYGGVRLIKACIRKFAIYCQRWGFPLEETFAVRYASNIPRQVGLAGSSAIIIATLRCLMEFYGIKIAPPVLASLALSVEVEELGISAGLQDRVAQAYEGLVYMSFAEEAMQQQMDFNCGTYEELDSSLLPPLYLAYSANESEPTEVTHNNLRARWELGDVEVRNAMLRFAELAEQAKTAILSSDRAALDALIDENFDLRSSICEIAPGQRKMIETARSVGVSSKFAGSGGAVIGTYPDAATFDALTEAFSKIGCNVIKPQLQAEG